MKPTIRLNPAYERLVEAARVTASALLHKHSQAIAEIVVTYVFDQMAADQRIAKREGMDLKRVVVVRNLAVEALERIYQDEHPGMNLPEFSPESFGRWPLQFCVLVLACPQLFEFPFEERIENYPLEYRTLAYMLTTTISELLTKATCPV